MKKIVFLCLLIIVSTANSFHINPSNRSLVDGSSDDHFLDRISEPVHEALTRKTREEYWRICDADIEVSKYCGSNRTVPSTINDSLIRGNWWADDPNQNLYKARQVVWLGNMINAERRAKSGSHVIDQKYKIHYRSHYGDMQFLHSMAYKDGISALETRDKIYMWLEFLYQIATKQIGPSTKFSEVDIQGLSKYFNRHQHWEIRWVMQPRYLLSRKDDFSEHAIGAMLHLIQDSYSTSHVERVFEPTSRCQYGYISRFYSYSNQNSKKHGESDTWEGYEKTSYPESSNPITVGAHMMAFAKSSADWKTKVLPYLDSTVFCLGDSPLESGPGEFH